MVTWVTDEEEDEPTSDPLKVEGSGVTWETDDPRGEGWNYVRNVLGWAKVPLHGMMDFLHYTLARPGSGAWRATTQLAEEAERQQIERFYGDDTSKLPRVSSEDIKNLPLYLRSQVLQYGDPAAQQDIAKLMIEGGGEAALRGFGEGFTYKKTPVESAWDITASGTA
jgi:hypothetical protein